MNTKIHGWRQLHRYAMAYQRSGNAEQAYAAALIDEKIALVMRAFRFVEHGTYEDFIDGEWIDVYGPTYIFDRFDPDRADRLFKFCQKVIFDKMVEAGMPLEGWSEFDRFLDVYCNGATVAGAYLAIHKNDTAAEKTAATIEEVIE